MCYIEIFDDNTNQWEYVAKSNEPEDINSWYNNLETFFEEFNLSYLLRVIENNEQLLLVDNYKELPKDVSIPILNAYSFYFYEVSMCQNASYINLSELISFDYSKTINLKEILKKDLKLFYPEWYKCKKEIITHSDWLSENFFIELHKTKQRFETYTQCRLIYFLYKIDID